MNDWRSYANKSDPAERLEARQLEGGGYECQTLAGALIGVMPADVFEEIYVEEEHDNES